MAFDYWESDVIKLELSPFIDALCKLLLQALLGNLMLYSDNSYGLIICS